MTSRVVRFPPESYSRVMPSLAISAAFNCAEVAKRTLLDDTYLDQLFDVFVVVLFLASCNKSLARCSLKDDFLVLKLTKTNSSVRIWSILHDKKVQGAKIKKWEKEFAKALRECADNEWTNLDYFWRKCPGDILELWKKENSILIGRKQKHTALTNKYCEKDDEDNDEESESSGMSDD